MTDGNTLTNVTLAPPQPEVRVLYMHDGQCMASFFVGEGRFEAALRYAQGLFDENTVSLIQIHEGRP